MCASFSLPKILFLSAYIPLYHYQQPSPFVVAQQGSLKDIGVPVVPFYVKGTNFLKYLRAIKPLNQMLDRERFELIHAHYSFSGAVALCQTHAPVVLSLLGEDLLISHIHGIKKRSFALFTFYISQLTAMAAKQVIVKSEEMRRKLWRKQGVHIVPNGINLDQFKPIDRCESRKALGLANDKHYILFPGSRNRFAKNFPLAERALQMICSQIRDVELLTLEAVPHERVPYYFNAANVVLFTSKMEGAPNVIKEAMACNAPIVTVDVGDTRRVVEGTDQCRVTGYDPEEIASGLVEVLSKDEPSNGRDRIQQYDQRVVAKRLLDIYYLALRHQV